jgi:hypothetical protein
MKKIILSVVVSVWFATLHSVNAGTTNVFPNVFTYTNFNGHPVRMEYDPETARLSLSIRTELFSEYGTTSDKQLEYLKSEVMRLTSSTNVVMLGDSGTAFHFKGGYPIWGPYDTCAKSGTYKCLFFAEGATMVGNFIEVQGLPAKPTTYYPYLSQDSAK